MEFIKIYENEIIFQWRENYIEVKKILTLYHNNLKLVQQNEKLYN